jgi:hypothetical protein
LQLEYDEMVIERKENDKQIEEVRDDANQVEAKVSSPTLSCKTPKFTYPSRSTNILRRVRQNSTNYLQNIGNYGMRQVNLIVFATLQAGINIVKMYIWKRWQTS